MSREDFIIISSRDMVRKIKTKEIDYIVQIQRKLRVVCESGEYEYYEKLVNIESFLGESFFRVLKFSYINLDRVDSMYSQCIEFCDGKKFHVGRNSFISAKQRFCGYLAMCRQEIEKSTSGVNTEIRRT